MKTFQGMQLNSLSRKSSVLICLIGAVLRLTLSYAWDLLVWLHRSIDQRLREGTGRRVREWWGVGGKSNQTCLNPSITGGLHNNLQCMRRTLQ